MNNIKKWLLIIFILLFLLILSIVFITNWLGENKKSSPKTVSVEKTTEIRSSVAGAVNIYRKYYNLKKGKIFRVKVPSGYGFNCYGGKKKYYYQAQNDKKPVVVGGDIPYLNAGDRTAYFDLSYYDEEIIVVVEFKLKK